MRDNVDDIEEESAVGDIKLRLPKEYGDDVCKDGDKQIYGMGSFLVILVGFADNR